MSKSSHPQASVFGALGPDDAYFGNRVQVAARDAQQRWPLLGELQPTASDEPPALTEDDKARWQPHPPLAAPSGKSGLSRPSLGKQLESGLGRLTRQTAVDNQLASHRERDEFVAAEDRQMPSEARAVRAALTEPAPLMAQLPEVNKGTPADLRPSARAQTRAAASAPAPVARPVEPARARLPEVPVAADKSLGSVFRRLAGQPSPAPAAPEAPRKSVLGRLGKR